MTGKMTEAQVLMRIDEELAAKDTEIGRLRKELDRIYPAKRIMDPENLESIEALMDMRSIWKMASRQNVVPEDASSKLSEEWYTLNWAVREIARLQGCVKARDEWIGSVTGTLRRARYLGRRVIPLIKFKLSCSFSGARRHVIREDYEDLLGVAEGLGAFSLDVLEKDCPTITHPQEKRGN